MNTNYLKFVNFDLLDLGKEYLISFGFISNNHKYTKRVKLIKVTNKGYNFLNIYTNKCIFKRHMYISKYGYIVLPRAMKVSNFEIEYLGGEERFVNINSLIR